MLALLHKHAIVIIGGLLVIGGLLHMYAWTELKEIHLFDIFMREGPPFEDLSATGQLLIILSWILAVAAAIVIVIVYVAPRFGEILR